MKILLVFFALVFMPFLLPAQTFPAKKYKTDKVTWLGLDFTQGRLVDHLAFTNPYHLASSYIPAWNNFVRTEPDKYDVKRYFHKHDIVINIDFSNEYNSEINPDNLVQDKIHKIGSDIIINDVKKYASTGLDGIGVVMYVESFNKNTSTGSYWLVFFDLTSGEALFLKRVYGTPRGFGVRNYWIATFLGSLKSIDGMLWRWLK